MCTNAMLLDFLLLALFKQKSNSKCSFKLSHTFDLVNRVFCALLLFAKQKKNTNNKIKSTRVVRVFTMLKPLTLVMHKNKVPLCVVVQQNEQMQQKEIQQHSHPNRHQCNKATLTHYCMKKKKNPQTHTVIFCFMLL